MRRNDNMIEALIYKDIKLMFKDNTLLLVGQFLFILIIISTSLGIAGYSILSAGICWTYLMNVSSKEKSSKGNILLLSTPYRKKELIIAKYLTAYLLFISTTLLYSGISEIFKMIHVELFPQISCDVFFITLLSVSLFVGITLPMYLKLDDSIIKIVSSIMILGTFIIGYVVFKQLSAQAILELMNWTNKYLGLLSISISILAVIVSYIISFTLMSKTEY